jgi:methionyl-tRNA formyltransferase
MKIAVAGKNELACRVLEYLLDSCDFTNRDICVIANKSDNGENSWQRSLKALAELREVRVLDEQDIHSIKDLLFLSLEYDRIVKVENFLSNRLFNIHFSYLPEYKGMYTSVLPLLFNEPSTGVTLHEIDNGIDTGRIVDQRRINLSDNLTSENLYHQLTELGVDLIKSNLSQILIGDYKAVPQSVTGSKYFPKGYIDFSNVEINLRQTAYQIRTYVNAFCFRPYQRPLLNGIEIDKAVITNDKSTGVPGKTIHQDEFTLTLNTIDYNVVLIKAVDEQLINAAENGDLKCLVKYKSLGGRIDFKNKKGWDIAIVAAYNGYDNIMYWALENGISYETTNYNGTNLAMYVMTNAINTGNYNKFELFLERYKSEIYKRDYNGNDLAFYAKKRKSSKAIELIKLHK